MNSLNWINGIAILLSIFLKVQISDLNEKNEYYRSEIYDLEMKCLT